MVPCLHQSCVSCFMAQFVSAAFSAAETEFTEVNIKGE